MTEATLRIRAADPYSMEFAGDTSCYWELELRNKIISPIQSSLDYKCERSALRGGMRFARRHNIFVERIFKIGE